MIKDYDLQDNAYLHHHGREMWVCNFPCTILDQEEGCAPDDQKLTLTRNVHRTTMYKQK